LAELRPVFHHDLNRFPKKPELTGHGISYSIRH